MKTDRIIVGATEQAGLPISAPCIYGKWADAVPPGAVRWRKKLESFVLEQYTGLQYGWVEVPCFVPNDAQ